MSSEAAQRVTIYDVLAWAETNKKSIMIAFVAAVVVGFGIAAYRYNAGQKELTASDALFKLKPAADATDPAAHVDSSAYLRIAQEHPGTRAAERAILLAGGSLFTEGKYAESQREFSKFLRDMPQSPFAAIAAYGVAAALEAQGKREEALAAYQNLSVRYPSSSVLDDAKLALARIYEQKNQPDQALRTYDELTKLGPISSASSQAATYKQNLLAKHPELVKTTNAPAVKIESSPLKTNLPAPAVGTTNGAAPAAAGAAKP